MKDRWVFIYLLCLIVQLPIYIFLGRPPLSYEFKSQEAEGKLVTPLRIPQEQQAVEQLLNQAEQALLDMPSARSRRARLNLDRGVLEWKRGRLPSAIEFLEESREGFVKHHGPDSFHAAALDLRIAELLFLQRRYPDAVVRFERSTQRVREYAGFKEPFPIRMTFRHVTALVSLGRKGEAAKLAKTYLTELQRTKDEHDRSFLTVSAGSLDILVNAGLLHGPPGTLLTWRRHLTQGGKSEQK